MGEQDAGNPADTPPDAAIGSAAPADAPLACAATYNLISSTSRYRVAPADTWVNAEKACEADGFGMHLVLIANYAEQQKIEGYVGGTALSWVGISDRKTNDTFLDVSGAAATYLPWAATYPSFAGPGCVILDPVSRNYTDGDCTQALAYVCECDLLAADPTSY